MFNMSFGHVSKHCAEIWRCLAPSCAHLWAGPWFIPCKTDAKQRRDETPLPTISAQSRGVAADRRVNLILHITLRFSRSTLNANWSVTCHVIYTVNKCYVGTADLYMDGWTERLNGRINAHNLQMLPSETRNVWRFCKILTKIENRLETWCFRQREK